jgi:predicted deacylase
MSKEIIIGTAHSKGQGISKGLLRIADAPDGSPIEAPVVIVQGSGDGPVMWMHGCVHGNEYCGTYIIHDFLRSLDPATLKGTVVAIPILNVSAFQSKRRTSPYEGYNGGDMNRQFPGDKMGTLTQQMAQAVFEPLQRYADVLVDFHTALTPDVQWALFPKVDGKAGELSEKVARAFGYRDTLPTPDTILAGSAMMTAAKAGIASFIVECGGKVRAFTDEAVADAVDRLHNILRALGMEDGAVKVYGPMTFFSNFEWVTATDGGLFERRVKCGDTVEAGTIIGQYYDAFGNPKGEARSPKPGVVLAIHSGPVMATGETLIHIGLDPRAA